jgi:serine/threonine-protein kinase
MAPEQIGAGQEVDFRSDIYAVGGILYFMLTGGRAPVEGDSVEVVWQRKLNDDPTPLRTHRPDLPGRLEALVMRCVARAPEDRPASMTELKTALVAALEGVRAMESGLLPVKAPSETAVVSRINWARIGAVAGGVMALALVGGLAWWRSTTPGVVAVAVTTPAPQPVRQPPPPPVAAPLPPAAPPPPAHAAGRPPAAARPAPRKAMSAPPPPADPAATAEALLAKGEAEFQRADFTQAIFDGKAALRLGAGARAHLLIAKSHLRGEEPEEAAQAYAEVLKLDPGNDAARKGLARARAELAGSK